MTDHVGILRCPITRQRLSWLDRSEIEIINASKALHADGSPIAEPLEKAVGTQDRSHIYRFSGGVFWLLPAVAIVEPPRATLPPLDAERRMVQGFYNDLGWTRDENGTYLDTAQFSEQDPNSKRYTDACDRRIGAELSSGNYLLDAASGAIPHDSYLAFSQNYAVRVCVDFSIRALMEAQTKLKPGEGLFVLGDLTQLPLADGAIDDAISLHTIYHVPKPLQVQAIGELVRVVKSGGKIVIVYTWVRSSFMGAVAKSTMAVGRMKHLLWGGGKASLPSEATTIVPDLFFVPQDRAWFEREIRTRYRVKLKLWSSTNQQFNRKVFAHPTLGGLIVSTVLTFERLFRRILAKTGQYPMFVIRKR